METGDGASLRAYQETLGDRINRSRSTVSRSGTGVVLYLHGGGFVGGGGTYMDSVAHLLERRIGRRVEAVNYRLAPASPYPAAVEDAVAACVDLWGNGVAPEKTALFGESAGGTLVVAALQRLQEMKYPLPGAWIVLSPWLDLTWQRRGFDGFLSGENLATWAALYAGEHPLQTVSPIYGKLSGLPPAMVFAGGKELLRSDAERLRDALKAAGGQCDLTVAEGKGHCYPIAGGGEAHRAFSRMRVFLDRHLKDAL